MNELPPARSHAQPGRRTAREVPAPGGLIARRHMFQAAGPLYGPGFGDGAVVTLHPSIAPDAVIHSVGAGWTVHADGTLLPPVGGLWHIDVHIAVYSHTAAPAATAGLSVYLSRPDAGGAFKLVQGDLVQGALENGSVSLAVSCDEYILDGDGVLCRAGVGDGWPGDDVSPGGVPGEDRTIHIDMHYLGPMPTPPYYVPITEL